MGETPFDWDDLRLFLAVAREGGLAAAAGSTGKSAPTLMRRMLALERHLNKELFQRSQHGYSLTDQGRALLATAAELEDQILPISTALKSQSAPLVKISAGTWVTRLLCGRIADLVQDDLVRLRFISDDHVLDIRTREAVIGIRNHRPEQVGLAGRRITRVRFAVYAVNDRVETWARVVGPTPSARWVQENLGAAPSVEVTSPRNALDLAIAGAVRTVLPTFVGDSFDALAQVTSSIDELEHDQWLVTHQDDRFMPEVRRIIDRVHATLRKAIH